MALKLLFFSTYQQTQRAPGRKVSLHFQDNVLEGDEGLLVETKGRSNGSILCFQKYYSCEISSCEIQFCDNLMSPNPAEFTPGRNDCIPPDESTVKIVLCVGYSTWPFLTSWVSETFPTLYTQLVLPFIPFLSLLFAGLRRPLSPLLRWHLRKQYISLCEEKFIRINITWEEWGEIKSK